MAANYYQNAGGNAGNQKTSGKAWRIVLIIVLAILIISPIDLIPGDAATVVGLIDDVGYVVGIICTIVGLVKKKSAQNTQEAYTPPVYNDVDSNEKR